MKRGVQYNPSFFSYAGLRRFLVYLENRFPPVTFETWNGSNAVLLRHDIDGDPAAALRVAEIEAEVGVRSTFFFMVTSPAYNILSLENRYVLRSIAEMGFEIGLHFDPSVHKEPGLQASQKADLEASILSGIIGKPIRSISIHNPSVHGQFHMIPGYVNAYDPRIFCNDRYLSDSRMILREDIYAFVQRVTHHPVQILLHPFHFTENGGGYGDIAYLLALQALRRIDTTFRVNTSYASCVYPDLVTYFLRRATSGSSL